MCEIQEKFDVIVIGGGPSGSTSSALLSRKGHNVLLLERERFPRFHIGESLTLFAPQAFRELGVYEELAAINYVKKRGLEFVLPDKSQKLFFVDRSGRQPGQETWTFQMARSKLDQVLLRNAKRVGVKVREQHQVIEVLFVGDRATGVSYKDLRQGPTAPQKCAFARWILDCSGQNGVINRQLKNNAFNDDLLGDKISIFSHWKGKLDIIDNDDETNFKLCVHDNRRDWFWWFPIDRDLVSIGLVIDRVSIKSRDKSLQDLFFDYASGTPFIQDFLRKPGLQRVERLRSIKDFSYRSKRYSGNGWALAGDSAGFLDPIFSTGLQIAFNSSFQVVDILDRILHDECVAPALWSDYQTIVERLYRLNSTLVYKFYECGIDFEKMQSAGHMIFGTDWASLSYALRFLLCGIRVIMHPHARIRAWSREVLFGNIRPGNRLVVLLEVLAENYAALRKSQMEVNQLRNEFINQEI